MQQLGRRKHQGLQLDLAGLDLGKVQDVVQQGQQGPAGVDDGACIVQALALRQFRLQQQLRHAQHAIERRADLVRHGGEEAALGHIGRFSRLLGLLQAALALLGFALQLVQAASGQQREQHETGDQRAALDQLLSPVDQVVIAGHARERKHRCTDQPVVGPGSFHAIGRIGRVVGGRGLTRIDQLLQLLRSALAADPAAGLVCGQRVACDQAQVGIAQHQRAIATQVELRQQPREMIDRHRRIGHTGKMPRRVVVAARVDDDVVFGDLAKDRLGDVEAQAGVVAQRQKIVAVCQADAVLAPDLVAQDVQTLGVRYPQALDVAQTALLARQQGVQCLVGQAPGSEVVLQRVGDGLQGQIDLANAARDLQVERTGNVARLDFGFPLLAHAAITQGVGGQPQHHDVGNDQRA